MLSYYSSTFTSDQKTWLTLNLRGSGPATIVGHNEKVETFTNHIISSETSHITKRISLMSYF